MKTYRFRYVREQRRYFDIEAQDVAKAQDLARSYINKLDMSSPDDQSDDPGELELEEEE